MWHVFMSVVSFGCSIKGIILLTSGTIRLSFTDEIIIVHAAPMTSVFILLEFIFCFIINIFISHLKCRMAFNEDPTGLSFNKITLYILLTDLSWVSTMFSSSLFIRSVSLFIYSIFLTAMRLSISLKIAFISVSRFLARGWWW